MGRDLLALFPFVMVMLAACGAATVAGAFLTLVALAAWRGRQRRRRRGPHAVRARAGSGAVPVLPLAVGPLASLQTVPPSHHPHPLLTARPSSRSPQMWPGSRGVSG